MNRPPLAACPSCSRHVRLSEKACPFCRVDLPSAFREQAAPQSPARRLNRAALHALRMGAVTVAAATACGGSVSASGGDGGGDSSALADGSSGAASSGSGSSGGASSGTASSGTTPSSGTASSGEGSSGVSSGSANDAGYDGPWAVAAYGAFIPFDASAPDTGSDAASQSDAGAGDAEPDHRFIAPPYGIPPSP